MKLAAAGMLVASLTAQSQPLVNLGLVGVGRLSGDSFDQLGAGVDTLGGIFSGMWVDHSTIVHSNGAIHVTVYGLPDRGFGDGLTDYHPRVQRLALAITPNTGPGPASQDQIVIVNTGTTVLRVGGATLETFTGANPDDTNVTTHPRSLPAASAAASSASTPKASFSPQAVAGALVTSTAQTFISSILPLAYRVSSRCRRHSCPESAPHIHVLSITCLPPRSRPTTRGVTSIAAWKA